MHIRIRNKVAQLIRTTYDPATKKGKNAIVGKVRLNKPDIDEKLRGELTAEELAQFETWRKHQERTSQLRSKLAALGLAETMAEASRWLAANADSEDARDAAASIQGELQHLRKALKKCAAPE